MRSMQASTPEPREVTPALNALLVSGAPANAAFDVIRTGPAYESTTFPFRSTAVTVMLKGAPAVCVPMLENANCFSGPGLIEKLELVVCGKLSFGVASRAVSV